MWTAVVDRSESGKFTAMIILHFDLQPQLKYMNYFIYTTQQLRPVCNQKGNKQLESKSLINHSHTACVNQMTSCRFWNH